MALRGYLAGEVAEDLVDGRITRREALHRLGLLGLGAGAAVALLAACGADDGAAPTTPVGTTPPASPTAPTSSPSGTARSGTEPAAAAETVTFAGPSGELSAYWAAASAPDAGLLVIHENRGLSDHFASVVSRFAAAGYSSLCVDLLSPEGGTAAIADDAGRQAALGAAPLERLLGDLRAGLDELSTRVPGKLGAIGFCFGGGMVWNLLNTGEARLAAASPFYGPAPDGADFSRAKAAVLAVYGALDTRVNATRESAAAALDAAGLVHETKTYDGADHAFFNDTGARYDEAAARQAFIDVTAWFDRYLA